MEQRFGHDFSRVRVYTDANAAKAAQVVNARAFTIGEHIYFDQEQYKPEYAEGKKLLSHELTHVIQQKASQAKSGSSTVHNYVPVPTIQRQLGETIGETIGSLFGGPSGRVLGGLAGRKIEDRGKKLKQRLEKVIDVIRGEKEVKLPEEDVIAINLAITVIRGLLPWQFRNLLPNALSGREQRFSPAAIVLAAPALAAFVAALGATIVIISAAIIAIILVEVLRKIEEIADRLEKVRPIPMTPTESVPVPRPWRPPPLQTPTTPTPTPKPPPLSDVAVTATAVALVAATVTKPRRRERCRDKDDPCGVALPIKWPKILPGPPEHQLDEGLERTKTGDPYRSPDKRSIPQRRLQQRITAAWERFQAGDRSAQVPEPCSDTDTDPNARHEAHHIHPLFLGGHDDDVNLCALAREAHRLGYLQLYNQQDMLLHPVWIACRVCEGNLRKHPGQQEYDIEGEK
jgi:hypothetical protein